MNNSMITRQMAFQDALVALSESSGFKTLMRWEKDFPANMLYS